MQTPRKNATRGFTMIELLVVISITMLLISQLLPAVQSAREAARRAQCVNNLAQLSLALQQYQGIHEVFPPGVIDAGPGPVFSTPRGFQLNWIVQILPQIEQAQLSHRLNFQHGAYAVENLTVACVRIETLLCPSGKIDRTPATPEDIAIGAAPQIQSSYAGCHDGVETPIAANNRGMLFLNSAIRPEDVGDGTSYTIMLGEKKSSIFGLSWLSGTRATLRNAGVLPNARETDYIDNLDPLDRRPSSNREVLQMPNGTTIQVSVRKSVGGFTSNHPGGINAAFADGSVRFLKSSISATVMQSLGQRNDGELMDSVSY